MSNIPEVDPGYHPAKCTGLRYVKMSKSASLRSIEYIIDCDVDAMFAEKDAEIERLKKVADQAIERADLRLATEQDSGYCGRLAHYVAERWLLETLNADTDVDALIDSRIYAGMRLPVWEHRHSELAAYLKEKS